VGVLASPQGVLLMLEKMSVKIRNSKLLMLMLVLLFIDQGRGTPGFDLPISSV
jgi:hypothetical protein